ncbi:MAG: hypothetical protein K0S75_1695 [Clostridia bacterium]|jgi:two-component system CitB family response regulator/two-component system response regulator DctR|nr:hypothetical protein [Clostridia bacterium]
MINVLIVDDDPMVAELNKRYVENVPNFKVVAVLYNGEDALKLLKSKKIELLILDIYMPKLDGISLLEEMRKNLLKTDVILVTAATEVNEIDKALKLGAVDYLIKPFDGDRIRKSLNNYLKRYNLLHGKKNQRVYEEKQWTLSYKRRGIRENGTIQSHSKTLFRIPCSK